MVFKYDLPGLAAVPAAVNDVRPVTEQVAFQFADSDGPLLFDDKLVTEIGQPEPFLDLPNLLAETERVSVLRKKSGRHP
jgi:hypothetical protein